jgi:hypothetical protein
MLAHLTSYADALTAALRGPRALKIDGLEFTHRADIVIPTDHASTGRHTLVFELAGTGKQYRVMIEPVPETHRAPPSGIVTCGRCHSVGNVFACAQAHCPMPQARRLPVVTIKRRSLDGTDLCQP